MSAQVAVIGSFVQDLAFKVASFPSPGETRIGEFFTGPGGKGSNQAVAAHRQGERQSHQLERGQCAQDERSHPGMLERGMRTACNRRPALLP